MPVILKESRCSECGKFYRSEAAVTVNAGEVCPSCAAELLLKAVAQ